ncbi:hypothetical protein HLB23_00180 [Nocardia uniformis]|uniref:Uncharacterized protein n=1 Tax=Nocardia uniformis TaxID=53432 RepID=A0A849BNN1_9NOCA|nr:hypothetical protein [Nocardia uniformis]NNH68312.1 hypothetical protein [Nocardia uniformis]
MKASTRIKVAAGTAAAVMAIAAAGTYVYLEYRGDDGPPYTGPRDWAGISAELNPPIDQHDQISLLTVSGQGQTTLAGKYPIAFEPTMERLGSGFAFPAGDRIVVVDESLHEVWNTELGSVAVLTRSASSPDGNDAVFAFNVGMNNNEVRHLLVKVSSSGQVSQEYVDGDISGLSICRAGEVQWLAASYAANPSTVRLNRWTEEGGVQVGHQYETGATMARSQSSVLCGDTPDSDRGYAIVISDSKADYRIVEISRDGGTQADSERNVPRLPGDTQSQAWGVHDGVLYWITREGSLNSMSLTGDSRPSSVSLPIDGDVPISATFEGNAVYIIHYPNDDRSVLRLSEFDLSRGICKGDTLELVNWRYQSTMANLKRGGASFITITSILPIDRAHTVRCR